MGAFDLRSLAICIAAASLLWAALLAFTWPPQAVLSYLAAMGGVSGFCLFLSRYRS